MSGFHSNYNPRNVIINYATVTFNSGFSEDVYFSISENSPRLSVRTGNSGDSSPAISADRSAIVTLTFMPQSLSAKILTSIYYGLRESDSTDTNFLGAAPMVIQDPSGSVFIVCKEAVLQSMSEQSLGADTGTVSFEFFVQEVKQVTALPESYQAEVSKALADLATATV